MFSFPIRATIRSSHGERPGVRQHVFRALLVALAALFTGQVLTPSGRAAPPQPVDFAHDVAPIFKTHCVECHGNGKTKGEFSLDTREAILKAEALVPGHSDQSELIERVISDDDDYRMP